MALKLFLCVCSTALLVSGCAATLDSALTPLSLVDIPVTSAPSGQTLTLSNGITREPLGTCVTPCTMRLDYNQPIMVTIEENSALYAGRTRFPYTIYSRYIENIFIDKFTILDNGMSLSTLRKLKGNEAMPKNALAMVNLPDGAVPSKRLDGRLPTFPRGYSKDGSCRFIYDVNVQGQAKNVRILYCTDRALSYPMKDAISDWSFTAASLNGEAIEHENVRGKLAFSVTTETRIIY